MNASHQGWTLIIGIALLLIGAATAFVTFVFNSSTPLQLGPIPFFAGCAAALIGLIVTVVGVVG
jgi:hypothetical protein